MFFIYFKIRCIDCPHEKLSESLSQVPKSDRSVFDKCQLVEDNKNYILQMTAVYQVISPFVMTMCGPKIEFV